MRQVTETYARSDWPRTVASTIKGVIANINSVTARMTTAQADIAALETAVSDLETAVTDLETATDWSALADYADDTAAAAGSVPVGALYRNGSVVMVRVT